MSRTNFEELKVYQMAEKLADLLWSVVMKWESFPRNTVGQQMVDAADSIGANIAEGTGCGSFQNNRRYIKIARGSLYETKHWLRRAYRRKLLTETDVAEIKPLVDNLAPMLNAYLKSIGRPRKS